MTLSLKKLPDYGHFPGKSDIFIKILSVPIKQLDKINGEFGSFQYFWQDYGIFEGQLINDCVLGRFHRGDDQHGHHPLKLTSQGSAEILSSESRSLDIRSPN